MRWVGNVVAGGLYCCPIILVGPSMSQAAGFSNFTLGAGPMGMGNAAVAHAEGITSIHYNPALQLEFDGVVTELGLTVVSPEKTLDSSVTMQSYESEDNHYTPAHFAAGYRLSEKISLGLTLNNPFGLGSEFPDDTVFRYATTESELTTWDLNPSIAWRAHDKVDIAAGVRGVRADTTLERMILLDSFGLSDGRQHFEADGTGYGWNAGVTIRPVDNWSIGLSYRSEVEIDFSGTLSFDLPVAGSPLQMVFPTTSAESDFTLPAQFFGGVAYQPSKKWVFEAAVRWEEYSSYDAQTVTTAQPVAGMTEQTIPKNWKDVWGYMLGASYQADSGYRFSVGYLYEEKPVPEETFEPGASGLDKHTVTVGLGKQFDRLSCRVSLAYDFYQDRDIENSTYIMNGTHSQENYSLAFTFGWTF
ncbi:OmpP1/FadL family transporter [Desulfopila sp. IMCC35008]|uniref:OmpP1/FadL family transporter n=1 Tax=Desulfopila sp. IMCC35008 TaxID=2653858 RepID=UPI0013CFD92F|nr:outer membrane protein transport protein [Desulfopila sp. IMCC35008]